MEIPKIKTKILIPVLVLAIALGAGQLGKVYAWNEGFGPFQHWGGCCGPIIDQGCCGGIGGCCDQNQQGCCDGGDGYQAGVSDAVYDYQNGLAYNPIGTCLPCHSQEYWNNFHEGYDHQWSSYQSQQSTQGTSVNVINSPGAYVSTNQESNQQQNPFQQLAHVACGFLNCGGPGPQYQQQGLDRMDRNNKETESRLLAALPYVWQDKTKSDFNG